MLKVETANKSGWGPLRELLLTTASHVVCGQEHRLVDDLEIDVASAWAKSQGYKSVWTPAVRMESGKSSGGVVVFVRDSLGVFPVRKDVSDRSEGRLVFAKVNLPNNSTFTFPALLRVRQDLRQ